MSQAVSTRPPFAAHPLALLALAFAAGILSARLSGAALPFVLGCSALSLALALLFFIRQHTGWATLLIVLAFCGAGAVLAGLERRGVAPDRVERLIDDGMIAPDEPLEIEGVLVGPPEPAPDSFYLTLRVEKLRRKETEREASGTVWLAARVIDRATRAEYEELELRYGARLRVMTALSRRERFRNPGVSSLTEYLAERGFDATGTIKSPLLVERLDDERVLLPLAWLYEWRARLLAEIEQGFSAETAGVLNAALLGNRYGLSRGAAERFRAGGTFHVLVISGLHITFIGALVMLLVRRLTKRRGWQFITVMLFLWAYVLAVGAEPAVVRAALMFTIVALAPVLNRPSSSLNALGGAALILLVWRPSDLFDPSFQLTFLSVLMIVTLAWPLLKSLEEVGGWRPTRATPYPPLGPRWWRALGETLFWSEKEWAREMARSVYQYRLFKTAWAARLEQLHVQRLLRYAVSALLVSASVQLGLLPLLILYFHRLSLASLFLNIVVGLLMAALSIVALAALFVSQLSAQLAAPLIHLAEWTGWLMIHSADPFIRAHVASVRLPEYAGRAASIYALYYLPLAFLTLALARWNPLRPPLAVDEERATGRAVAGWAALALIILLGIILAHPLSAGRADGRLRVDFLDVGQGDAALVTMPDGTTLLIDGGGRPGFQRRTGVEEGDGHPFERDERSIGEAVVSEYLWWRGLDRVDYILATHADSDHIDGLSDVARNFKVRAALVARAPRADPEYARFASVMSDEGVPVLLVGRGDSLRFGAVVADVLWPTRSDGLDAPSNNDDSVVLRLRLHERTFLLTGDIESRAEGAILATRDDLHSDLVKVAHHGSKTSSTQSFVTATRASIAIVPVGLTSPFGHPRPEVLTRWRAGGAEVLTTGERGTVTVSTDGHDLKVETMK
ncbi:MAG TPA: ComEC/Rec2 family competence protein [Pyrinomonadaceae bacterium]|jgi:competence protein ComEC|nr:ComEC/Rec2 family competence protein [Pyrinomonadaceae bacterium]